MSFALQASFFTSSLLSRLSIALTLGLGMMTTTVKAMEPGVYAVQVPMYRFEDYERRHFIEYCSAFLLAPKAGDIHLVSAWHCIDGWEPTWAPIRIYLNHDVADGRIRNSGGSMQDDWLIIDLNDHALPKDSAISVANQPPQMGEQLVAVGFGPVGPQGTRYQRSVECRVSSVTTTINAVCDMVKGDSGGLLARQTSEGLKALGIVSSKSSSGTTQFTPVTRVLSRPDR
tara:strand:- start:4348 stop:5034 length:687 start_codon:yes stop_codon:yes gene_type:complete